MRTYRAADQKEAFAYLDWLEFNGVRFDLVQTFDGTKERLAASRAPEDWRTRLSRAERRFEWTEAPGCPALDLLAEVPSRAPG